MKMVPWSEQRVLVTGGAGFLGTHVVTKLREAGACDVVVVRSADYDLTNEVSVRRLFADVGPMDVVFHLAGLVGGIGANKARPADYYYQNLLMGAFTMHHTWLAGVKK